MKARIHTIDLAYDDHGMGTPIIFLHAFPLNRTMWRGQIMALLNEQRYRLVALDFRGFGESDTGVGVTTMEQLADDVIGLMDNLGMQQAILCGLSMGGYVSFAAQRKYPQRINGLILADTKPEADNGEVQANREKVALQAETVGTSVIADAQIPRLITEQTRKQHPEVEMLLRRMIEATSAAGLAAASRGMGQRLDSNDVLVSIDCPTLVIVGEQDGITPPTIAQSYAAKIAGAQCVVIPQAGHLSNLEQPELFLEAVRSFLRSAF